MRLLSIYMYNPFFMYIYIKCTSDFVVVVDVVLCMVAAVKTTVSGTV